MASFTSPPAAAIRAVAALSSSGVAFFFFVAAGSSGVSATEVRSPTDPMRDGAAEPGTLGCGFAFADAADAANRDASAIQDGRPVVATVNELRANTQAATQPELALGLELTHVAGADIGGLGFHELDAALARASLDAGRPVELRFKRPTLARASGFGA